MARSGDYSIVLSWINTLGGWENWNFEAFKTYGYQIGAVETIKKDIYQNWDTDFIAGETESEHLSLEASETIRVRSQILTLQQINAIARIKYSIRVRQGSQTVIVDKSSFQYRTDHDKNLSIEFNITKPGLVVQSL